MSTENNSQNTKEPETPKVPEIPSLPEEEHGVCFYVFVFIITCIITFGILTGKSHYDKSFGFNESGDSKSFTIYDCPFFNDVKPKNDQGIENCVINSPFNEEIHKYNFWPNYKQFNETYYGKFEVIERQMSHPINVTFYDKDWKEVEAHSIHDMAAEDIANLIREKGFKEHADKGAYRKTQQEQMPVMLEETRKKVKEIFEKGTPEEIKSYEQALSALSISKEEFLNPEDYKKRKIEESIKRN